MSASLLFEFELELLLLLHISHSSGCVVIVVDQAVSDDRLLLLQSLTKDLRHCVHFVSFSVSS